MSKNNKKQKSSTSGSVKDMTLTRYTYPAWMKCYPGSDREEWAQRTFPYSTGDYIKLIVGTVLKDNPEFFENIRRLIMEPIGDPYFEYLKETGKKNDTQTRCAYRAEEETRKKIFTDEGWFRDYHLCCLPLTIDQDDFSEFQEKTEFSLNPDTAEKIGKELENFFGKRNVFVSEYLLTPDSFMEEEETLLEHACDFFEKGERTKEPRFNVQENQGEYDELDLILPVVIKGNFNKMEYTAEEIFKLRVNDCPERVFLGRPDEDLDDEDAYYTDELIGLDASGMLDRILPMIKKDIDEDDCLNLDHISAYLVTYAEFPDFNDEIIHMFDDMDDIGDDMDHPDTDDDDFLSAGILPFYRYSYSAWRKLHPRETMESWEEMMKPYSMGDFLMSLIDELDERGYDVASTRMFSVVPFGDDYVKFLERTGKKDNLETRNLYAEDLTDEKIEEEFKKEGWFRDYHLCCMPLLTFTEEMEPFSQCTDFSLSKETAVKIEKKLETIFGKGNVFVSDYLLKPDVFYNEKKRLLDLACAYFEEGERVRFWKFKEQKNSRGINSLDLVLPVVIKGNFDKMDYLAGEVFHIRANDYPHFVYMGDERDKIEDDEYSELLNTSGTFSEIMPLIHSEMTDDIHVECISPGLIRHEEYPMVMEEFYEELKKHKNVKTVDVYNV